MSVAVCRSSAACFESILALPAAFPAPGSTWLLPPMVGEQQEEEVNEPTKDSLLPLQVEEEHVKGDIEEGESERPLGQFKIWTSIQAHQESLQREEEPYVHPLMRRSSTLLTQKSLEICTESLGSETGSDDFFSSDDETGLFSLNPKTKETEQQSQHSDYEEEEEEEEEFQHVRTSGSGIKKELATVNYHCSISRRSSQPRSFPPPLPSISRRDGPCLQMRPHRRDGRLVVQAVTVPSQNYLHAERHNGRLLLSFIDTTSSHNHCTAAKSTNNAAAAENAATQTDQLIQEFQQTEEDAADQEEEVLEAEEDQAEEEEEVEVVDRGTVVEVKVSTQPQHNTSGGPAAMKVHRSSIVINKFVSCMPVNTDQHKSNAISAAAAAADADADADAAAPPQSPVRRLACTSTTTAAAAAVAASSLSALSAVDGSHSSTNDNKLLFTSRRRNREELLHDMRRCSQLRKPLFIWEPFCIATSS